MADGNPDLVPILTRWQDAGGIWRVVARSGDEVTVALCRCDGGEEVDRLSTGDVGTLRFLANRSDSEDRTGPIGAPGLVGSDQHFDHDT
jgi:hypothetical protein